MLLPFYIHHRPLKSILYLKLRTDGGIYARVREIKITHFKCVAIDKHENPEIVKALLVVS